MNQKRTDGPNMTSPHQHPTIQTQISKSSIDKSTFDDIQTRYVVKTHEQENSNTVCTALTPKRQSFISLIEPPGLWYPRCMF